MIEKRVEITLNSGVKIKGVLLNEKNPIIIQEMKCTLPHLFIKSESPFFKKVYKSNEFVFNEKKTPQGGLIPLYSSSDYDLVLKREYTVATVYLSTIKTMSDQ